MNQLVQGIITPILTPMYEDESINFDELRNQVNRLIAAGVSGLFCFGTNGESYIISEEEKYAVLSCVIEETAGRVPVYAGTGCPGTKDTIRMSLKAKELGADVLSIICPYFAAANQQEIYNHYAAVAKAVDLPIVIYNIPPRTGNAVAPSTVGKLAHEFSNIVGVKDSSGNFLNMQQYIEATRDIENFSVLSGNDALIFDNLVNGGAGAIAGCSNIYPKTDVLSIICPYFAAANQQEIYNHYAAVAKAVDLPIVIYNIPPRTGNAVAPSTVGKLAHEFSNIVGVKDSSGNFLNMQQYIEATRDIENFSVLSGNDALIFDNLVNGGAGAIAGCSNIYPKTICQIVEKYKEGKLDEALALQRSLVSLRDTFKYGNPNTMIKYATQLLGYPVGSCRAPFNSISGDGKEALRRVLDENREKGME